MEKIMISSKKVLKICLLWVSLIAFLGNCVFAGKKLTIMTEDWPPLNYKEGKKLKGPAVEIVQAIKKRLKLKGEIKVLHGNVLIIIP